MILRNVGVIPHHYNVYCDLRLEIGHDSLQIITYSLFRIISFDLFS